MKQEQAHAGNPEKEARVPVSTLPTGRPMSLATWRSPGTLSSMLLEEWWEGKPTREGLPRGGEEMKPRALWQGPGRCLFLTPGTGDT